MMRALICAETVPTRGLTHSSFQLRNKPAAMPRHREREKVWTHSNPYGGRKPIPALQEERKAPWCSTSVHRSTTEPLNGPHGPSDYFSARVSSHFALLSNR